MTAYILDTFAWIEHINGSTAGKNVGKYISSGSVSVPTVVISELVSKLRRENSQSEVDIINFIINRCGILELSIDIALDAGKIHAKLKKEVPRLSLPDAIIIATAKKLDAKIVTGDEHFRNFENIIMIK